MKVDLHCHTAYSFDAISNPHALFAQAKKAGLDALAITDHNTTRGWAACREASRECRLPLILGEEITTVDNGRKIGDLIGLFLSDPILPGPPLEVIDAVRDQDGLLIIPHPFDAQRRFRGLDECWKEADAIETLNARVWRSSHNERARDFAERHGIPQAGCSDAHAAFEVGTAYTVAQAADLEEFRKALRKGRVWPAGRRSSILVHAISTIAKTGVIGRA